MAAADLDDQIARLYALPLADFTTSRNLLAKQAGSRAADVRALPKPPVAAWAVNQVFWRDRAVYDRLVEAAADFHTAHSAVLRGKGGDVRAAGKVHEEAIRAAVKSALGILRDDGHPATDATRQAIATTLRALPGPAAPGQLTATLQPGGFEMLEGLQVRGRAAVPRAETVSPSPSPATPAAAAPRQPKVDVAAQQRAKAEAEEADRAVRLAEHAAHREAFDAARASREADKAGKAVASAREAVDEAARALAEAEQAAAAATKASEDAAERAAEAAAALEAAREKARGLSQARRGSGESGRRR